MKRCWFGAGLLALLLILGLVLSLSMGNFHRQLAGELNRAAALCGDDRAAAQQITDEALARWENRQFLTAVLSDHAPLEEIGEQFLLLNPQAELEDFRETCLRLAFRLDALGQAQLPTLENLF